MRRAFSSPLSAFGLILATGIAARVWAAPANDDPALIVLVLFDAMRNDHLSVNGYHRPTTPNIDAFAREGTRYSRMYANAPWTRPSTTSFLTGYQASRHRTETDSAKLPAEITTLAQRLKDRGYTTAGFTANGNGGSLAGLQKGFDVFEDPTLTYPRKMRGKTYCCNGLPTGELLVQRAIDWLEKDESPKRFVFIFFVDPHDPYGAPPEIERMMLGPDFKGTIRRNALWEYDNDYPEDERYSLMALYDAGIHYADQSFGTLVDYLRKQDVYDRSQIFVSADHGEGFGEHGFYLHAHHFWEEVLHIPLIARGKGFSPGSVDGRLISSIDVSATIATLAGADTTGLTGASLLLPPEPNSHVMSEYNEYGIHRQAIVGERYKVIWQRPADEQWYMRAAKDKKYFPSVSFGAEVVQVFDLKSDPGEKKDLSAAMPAEAAGLLEQLRQFVAASPGLAQNGAE